MTRGIVFLLALTALFSAEKAVNGNGPPIGAGSTGKTSSAPGLPVPRVLLLPLVVRKPQRLRKESHGIVRVRPGAGCSPATTERRLKTCGYSALAHAPARPRLDPEVSSREPWERRLQSAARSADCGGPGGHSRPARFGTSCRMNPAFRAFIVPTRDSRIVEAPCDSEGRTTWVGCR
jgi:hypothetical protein